MLLKLVVTCSWSDGVEFSGAHCCDRFRFDVNVDVVFCLKKVAAERRSSRVKTKIRTAEVRHNIHMHMFK